jgi:hypothetical protein
VAVGIHPQLHRLRSRGRPLGDVFRTWTRAAGVTDAMVERHAVGRGVGKVVASGHVVAVPLGRRGQMTFRADRRATGLRPLPVHKVDHLAFRRFTPGGRRLRGRRLDRRSKRVGRARRRPGQKSSPRKSWSALPTSRAPASEVGVEVSDDDGRLTWGPSAALPARIGLGTVNVTLLTVPDAACAVSKMYSQAADNPPTRTLIDTRSDRLRTLTGDTGEISRKGHDRGRVSPGGFSTPISTSGAGRTRRSADARVRPAAFPGTRPPPRRVRRTGR